MNDDTRDTEDLEARGTGSDAVEEEETEDDNTKDQVTKAVEECFEEGGEAYEIEDKNAAIDAVIAKLEGMKDGGPELGGLGAAANEGMPLPEAEA